MAVAVIVLSVLLVITIAFCLFYRSEAREWRDQVDDERTRY